MTDLILSKNFGPAFNAPAEQEVVHSLESPIKRGLARELANGWFRNPSNKSSCHTIADPAEVVDTVPDTERAWHCGNGNATSLGTEHCGRASFTKAEWMTADGQEMLQRAARRMAQRCVKRGWKRESIRWLSVPQVAANARGLCTHNDMRLARGGTTHWDPGPNFPYAEYLGWVLGEYDRITTPATPDNPNIPEDEVTQDDIDKIVSATAKEVMRRIREDNVVRYNTYDPKTGKETAHDGSVTEALGSVGTTMTRVYKAVDQSK